MSRFGRALMLFLGVVNLGFALWVLIDPLPVASALALSPSGPAAAAELRAMYGGLIGGFGVLNHGIDHSSAAGLESESKSVSARARVRERERARESASEGQRLLRSNRRFRRGSKTTRRRRRRR